MSDTRKPEQQGLPRRDFMRSATMAAAGLTIVPRHVLGRGQTAPSDMVNVAGVGVGGMGRSNMTALSSQNIVALCDVDWGFAARGFDSIPQQVAAAEKRLTEAAGMSAEQKVRAQAQIGGLKMLGEKVGKATRYVDYREMLEKQKDIDAVMIATPDHTHATIGTAAMSLGKHVYVQKPLAWSVEECRALAKKAIDTKVVTQMGNQGHSSDDARLVNEYIQSGAIGEVREVHIWTNRPYAYWPQGIPRPEPSKLAAGDAAQPWNLRFVMDKLAGTMLAASHPLPDKLAWDLFLGPAPQIEYHPVYHPFNWRGWTDWGVGAIGDMGAHLIDHAVWALDLGYPTTIETQSTPYNKATYPAATSTYYEFPARGAKPAVKVTWYDGGLLPPKPEDLGTEEFDKGGGVLYIGSKGKLMHGTYAQNPRLLPKAFADSTPKPPQTFKRVPTSHEMNWIDAIRGRQEATSPFSYAAKLTEIMLLGVVALNAGKKIQYDGATMKIANAPEAEQFLRRQYRQGWSLS
jgi:predicted dehydrogenase